MALLPGENRGDWASDLVLGYLRMFEAIPDCAMAIDLMLDDKINVDQLEKAGNLIIHHFGTKRRSQGNRLHLRDDIVGIIYGRYADQDTLSYYTRSLGKCLLWLIEDGPENTDYAPSAIPIKGDKKFRIVVGRLNEFVYSESRRLDLPGQIVKILSKERK